MPLDAIAVRAAAAEILKDIKFGRVEKIYQPERDEIMLTIKTEKGQRKLVISAGSQNPRMYITSFSKENPAEPPMFCMLMRKHLSGAKIMNVAQIGFERITDIEFESRNEMGDAVKKHIICETMGKNSNIMLTDENMKIIDSVKHVDIAVSQVRNIFPGLTYTMPPDSDRLDPLLMDSGDFYRELCDCPEGKNIDRALSKRVGGISPLVAREAAFRALGDASLTIGEIGDEGKRKISEEFYEIFNNVKNGIFSPVVIYKEGELRPFDFSAIDITQYTAGFEKVKKESVCLAMEDYYKERDMAERMRSRSYALMKNIGGHTERLRKKTAILLSTLEDAKNRDKYRIYGDIITANIYRMKKGDKILRAVNYYDEEQKEVTIALDEAKSPSKNAQNYYKKYTKAKTAEAEAARQLEIAYRDIEYLESVANEIERATSPSELDEIMDELNEAGLVKKQQSRKKAPKKAKISPPEEYSYMGYTIFSGKNNLQNDYLTMRLGRANDLWLHTKNIPGSHVLVKYMGEEIPNEVISAAAVIAATNSKGVNSPKVDVDYCPVSHVKKISGAKAGMVIYEGYSTASVAPDRKFCEKIKKN